MTKEKTEPLNPFKELISEHELTVDEFNMLIDGSYFNTSNMIHGRLKTIPKDLLLRLMQHFKIDPEEFKKQYAAFRDYKRREVIAKLEEQREKKA